MNNKKGLSAREKFLIGFLAVMVTIVGSVLFLFMPAIEKLGYASDQMDVSGALYESVRAQAMAAPGVAMIAEETREQVRALAESVTVFHNVEILEREFTHFKIDNDLSVTGITVGGGSAVEGLGPNQLVTLTLNMSVSGDSMARVLRLAEYVNETYSYRLLSTSISGSGMSDPSSASFVIEATLITY